MTASLYAKIPHLECFLNLKGKNADKLTWIVCFEVVSAFGSLHHVDVGCVSEVHAASIFRVQVSRVVGCSCVYRLLIQHNGATSNICICMLICVYICVCSEPSQIRLQLLRIAIWKMENAVRSWVHTLKDTRHLRRQMSHLSVQKKLDSFFKPVLLLYAQKQVQLVFYRWIYLLSFYSF
jgi:hypothetical protein